MSDHEKEKPKKDHGLFHSLRRSASKRFHRKSPARSVPVVIIHNKNAHEDEQKLVVSPSDESIKLIDSPVVPPPPPPPQPPSADIKDAHRKEKDGKFARLKKRLRKRSAPPSLLTFHRFLTHDKDTGGVLENKGVYNEGVDVSEPSIPAPYQSYPQPPGSASLTRKHKWYDGFRTAPLPRKNSKKNSSKDENKPKDNDTENMVKYGVTPTSCSCHFGQTHSVKAGRGGATRCVGCGHYSNNFAKAHGHQRKYSAPDIKYGQPANKEFLQSPSSHMSQKRLRNMCQPIVPTGVDYSATTLPSKSSQKGYIDMANDNSVCRTVSESGMIGQPFDYSSNTQTFPRIRTSPTHPNESAPVQQQNSLLDSLHRKYYSHQYERKDIKLGTRAYKRSPEQSGKSDSESDSSRVSVAGPISPDTVQRDLSISSTSIGNRSSRESSPGIVNILKVSEGMDKYATSSVTVSACSCPHHLDSDTVSVQSYRSSSSSSNKAGDCADNLPHDHGRRGSVESDSSGLNLSNSLRSNKSSGSNRSRKSFDASSLRVVKPVKLQSFDEMNAAVQRSVTDKRRRRSCDDGSEQLNFSSPARNKTASTRDGSTSEASVKTNGSLNRNRPKSCDRDRRNGSRNKRDSSLSNRSSVNSNRESERSSFSGMSSSVQSDNSDVLGSPGNDDQMPSSATSRRIFDELLLVNKELEISSASSFFNDSNDEDGCFNFDRILRDDEDFVGLDDSAVVDADCEFNFEQVFEQRLNAFGEKSNTLKQSDFNLSDFAESGDSSSSSSQSTLCSEPGTVDGRATVDDEKATASLKNAPSSLTMTPSNVHLLSLSSSQTDENSNETMSLDRALIKKNHPIIPSSTMVHHGSVFSLPSNENKRSSDGFISLEDMVRDLKSLMTEKELAEIEAIEACRWLRAAGFPQYAQMYEDQQFPIELGVVEKDHDFLDRDQLQSLFRRLNTLNRCTTMKIDTSSRKAVNDVTQDESDDEDQCALSDKWKFQRSNHRWSRKELEDTPPIPVVVVDSSASQPQPITSCSSHDSVLTDNDSSGHVDDSPKLTPKSLPLMSHLSPGDGLDVGSRLHPDDADDDDLTSPRLRRAASEKIKGAKTFFKRMESLKGNKRKKNNNNGGKQQHISKEGIGSPTLTDVEDMQARIERLNCVDICSADEMSPPLSPSLGQYSSVKAFSDTDCSPVHERYGLNAAAASENTLNPSRSDSESLGSQIRHKRNLSDLAGATGYTDMSREFRIPKVLSNGYIEAGSGSLNYRTGSFNLGSDSAEKDEMLDRVRRRTESTHSQCPREHRVSFYDNVTPDEPDPQKELDKVLEDLFQNINSLANFGGEDGEDSNLNNELATTSKPEESSDDAFTIPGISIDSPEKTSSPIEIKPPRHSHTSEEGIQFDFDQTDESAVFEGDNVESPCSDVQITRHMVVSTTDTSSAPETVSDLESPLSPEDGSEQSTSSARERRDSGVGSSLTRTPSERRRPRIRWHSFQKSHRPSLGSKNLQISSHSAGQLMVLRKLALLKLTGIMDKYSPSNRTGWSWTMPKFIKRFRAPDYKDKNVFGVPLLVMLQRTVQPLPQCILYAMRHLRRTAPEQVGIFRKSGVRSRIQKLRNQLESNPDMIDFESIQEYDVADLLKQYFRELPECLLTNKFSEIFISIYTYLPPDQRLEACQSAIMLMPDENREVLQSLLLFLSDLAQHSEKNQMNASNLAVCFAPSIFNILRNTDNRSASNSPKRGRKHTGGIPDQKELVEQKAAHECLTQMITECKKFFMIPEDALKKCRFSYIEQGDPSTLEELCKTLSDGKPNYPSYIESCIQGVLKESREKFKGWVSIPSETDVDLSYKKVGDGHPLRLWKCALDVPAPPIEVLNRVLRERHLWDEDLLKWRIVERLDKETEIFQNVRNSMAPHPTRDYTTLRSWRTDLPKGACCLVATSVEHPEAPLLGGVRAVVLASRYLIEPCGSGKSRITHMCRTDTRGRTPEWYNKAFGHMCATLLLKVRESFKHSTPTHGPETKV
ncbi:rho GTPase-activating protein 7-like isoform X2 [Tubulanus polymorphus]|uniref:rho GTPase-activating protein 7-like isoform X2 n=1 Tax=Tubulanus polymorphus TaxID=672921 RepID=UPI003DA29FED